MYAYMDWFLPYSNSLLTLKIIYFLIIYWQEKMKGKNKLVPRLLGVTKESILRVDEKTKEVWITSLVQSC